MEKRRFVVAATATALALAGCSALSDADEGADSTELVIAIPDEFPTLAAPWGYQPQLGLVSRNIHEPLLDRDPETAELVPGLAQEWEQVDEVTWRFYLREGVTMHDGSPFNAESAAYSINDTYAEENKSDPAYAPISGRAAIPFEAVVVDEYTLDIVSEEPDPLILAQLFATGISSKEQLEERRETYDSEPIGTGAYRFVEWNRGSSYELEVNEDWWGWESDDVAHKPAFDRVTFLVRPEASSRIAAVRAGEADIAWDLPPEECQSQLEDQCIQGPNPTTSYVRIDTPHPTLADPRVKEALAISIDRETIGAALLGGAPPASQLDVQEAFGFAEDLEPFPYEPDRARELLESAAADGVDLDVELSLLGRQASFAGDAQVLEALQAAWTDIGLNISAEMMETVSYNNLYVGGVESYEEGRAGLFLLRWPNDYFDVARTMQSNVFCPSTGSIECHEDLVERARATMAMPPEEREEASKDVMRDFYTNMGYFAFLPLNELRIFHGVGEGVDWTPRPDVWLYSREVSPN